MGGFILRIAAFSGLPIRIPTVTELLVLIVILDRYDIKSIELFHFLIVYEFKFKFNNLVNIFECKF